MKEESSVKIWMALDKDGNNILINNAEQGIDYYCCSCGNIVRARAKESKKVTEHFYHLEPCECNGEDILHKYWKEYLIEIEEIINLPEVGQVTCIDKRIEFRLDTKHGIYIPDLIIKTNNLEYQFIIFEIYNTNAKKLDEYYDIWKELNYIVFEVDIKKLNRDKSNFRDNTRIIYSKKRDGFVKESKQTIKKLYILKKNNRYMGMSEMETVLGRFYRIFKKDLLEPVRTNLEILNHKLENNWWDRDMYRDFVIPLTKILNKLHIYV